MAELAAAPPLETNTAQFDQPELTPMQRFARPLYAAALGVRESLNSAVEEIGRHRHEAAAVLATGAVLTGGTGIALGARSKAAQSPSTPITPPTVHYMKTGTKKFNDYIRVLQKDCPIGLTIGPSAHQQTKQGSTLRLMKPVEKAGLKYTTASFHKAVGAKLCKGAALAYTADGKSAFLARFNAHGVFTSSSPRGSKKAPVQIVTYLTNISK